MKPSLLKIALVYFLVASFVGVALVVAARVLRPTFLAPVTEVLFAPGFFAAGVLGVAFWFVDFSCGSKVHFAGIHECFA